MQGPRMCDHPKGLVFLTSSFAMVGHVLAVLREARPDLTVTLNTFHSRNPEFEAAEALHESTCVMCGTPL